MGAGGTAGWTMGRRPSVPHPNYHQHIQVSSLLLEYSPRCQKYSMFLLHKKASKLIADLVDRKIVIRIECL